MFTMASSSTLIASHSFPSPVGWAKCKRMARRLMNQDKDSLIGEVKSARSKQSRNSLHPFHQQANVQSSPGRQGLGIHKASLGRQMSQPPSPLLPLSLEILLLNLTWQGIWQGSIWVSCSGYVPFQPQLSLSLLTEGTEWEAEKALTTCRHCSAMARTLVYYWRWCRHKSKARHPMGHYVESWLHTRQTQFILNDQIFISRVSWTFVISDYILFKVFETQLVLAGR